MILFINQILRKGIFYNMITSVIKCKEKKPHDVSTVVENYLLTDVEHDTKCEHLSFCLSVFLSV